MCLCRGGCWSWTRFAVAMFAIMIVTFIGLAAWQLELYIEQKQPIHMFFLLVSTLFVGITIPLTVWQIAQHILNWSDPERQTLVTRILWMVPIYCWYCWCALKFPDHYEYFLAVKAFYEAYTVCVRLRAGIHLLSRTPSPY